MGVKATGSKIIQGVQALLCTPMTGGGALDYDSTWKLIDHVLEGGADGVILLGSTGEFFSLAEAERREFTERVLKRIGGRVPVGVCTGTPGTATTVALSRHAESCGADYLLVPVPFYFANTLPGIVDFYLQVASSVSIAVMPYDGGGGLALDMETWRRIVAGARNISMAKITVPLPPKIKWLHEEFGGAVRAFGGSDNTILLSLANGACGLTVAGANIVPRAFADLWRLYAAGCREEARRLYYQKISPLNVIAVPAHTEFIQCYKQALFWMGIIAAPFSRPPMMPLDGPRQEELRAALEFIGVRLVR
jgi:4-hydroxy-tetrahydrodipicolinate synthase